MPPVVQCGGGSFKNRKPINDKANWRTERWLKFWFVFSLYFYVLWFLFLSIYLPIYLFISLPSWRPWPPQGVKNVTYIITFLYPPRNIGVWGGGGKKCNMGIARGYTCYVIFSKAPHQWIATELLWGGGTLGDRNCKVFSWDTQKIYVIVFFWVLPPTLLDNPL
jgi:hypothetical protein